MLVNAHDGTIDHLNFAVVGLRNCLQNLIPNTRRTPADKAIVAGGVRAIAFWNIGPGRAGAEPPEDAVQHAAVVNARHSARFVRQKRCDDFPLGI